MQITLRDGRTLDSAPAQARGGPDAPITDDALRAKYYDLARPTLGDARAKVIETVRDSGPGQDVSALLDALLQPA